MKRAFSTREKVLLVVLAALLIGIGYFKLILEPINDNIDHFQQMTASEQDEILINTARLAQMRSMQTELDEIFAAGDAKPIPEYDNSGKLLVELHSILSKSTDYSLSFGAVTTLEGGYIQRRPVSMNFTTADYARAADIIKTIHDSDNTNQISDVSIAFKTDNGGAGSVSVSLSVTYYELIK